MGLQKELYELLDRMEELAGTANPEALEARS